MTNIYVKPVDGARVRQPERGNQVMPEEGASVPVNGYYTQLLRFGDVVKASKPKPAKQTKEISKKEAK